MTDIEQIGRDREAAWALMLKHTDDILGIHDRLDDEGDRVYLGSTNDADRLREISQIMHDLRFEVEMDPKPVDWHGAVQKLANERDALTAERDALRAALISVLDVISEESGWGTWRRMEGSEIYNDASKARETARAALEKGTPND